MYQGLKRGAPTLIVYVENDCVKEKQYIVYTKRYGMEEVGTTTAE